MPLEFADSNHFQVSPISKIVCYYVVSARFGIKLSDKSSFTRSADIVENSVISSGQ